MILRKLLKTHAELRIRPTRPQPPVVLLHQDERLEGIVNRTKSHNRFVEDEMGNRGRRKKVWESLVSLEYDILGQGIFRGGTGRLTFLERDDMEEIKDGEHHNGNTGAGDANDFLKRLSLSQCVR